ncbi:MAG: shikimate dehydrogenase family protein [Nitrosarchaeum sp.]
MDGKTKKYISIAEKPGKFGVWFHNKAYTSLGLNNIYLPLKLEKENLESFVNVIKDNFDGCSVSMPHKINIINYLNEVDSSAKKVGAVNTVTNTAGILKGYNTDYYGAKKAIRERVGSLEGRRVLMMGAGGVSKAIGSAVLDLGGELYLTNRSDEKGIITSEALGCSYINWKNKDSFVADFFINATPVGMESESPVLSESVLGGYKIIMDAVVNETPLIKQAKIAGQSVVPGVLMTTYQAEKQFEIYTGKKLDKKFIDEVLRELLK